MSRRLGVVALLVVAALALAACAPGPNAMANVGAGQPAGFWLGLWQGLISPITFIVSLFTSNVNIYEVHNNGSWYNFGFMLGVSCAFSGAARSGSAGRRARSSGTSST